MERIVSADGTVIALDRLGAGPPVVIVGGALCDRSRTRDTAEAIARDRTAMNYDRRGRGDSGDTPPYDVGRELEDLAAVVRAAGGDATVYGHSSGAALALRAAANGVPMARLVLHDPPYGPDTAEQRDDARAYLDALGPLLARDRRDDAVALFLQVTGLPAEVVEQGRREPWWPPMRAMAHTLAYDAAVLGYGEATGGSVPRDIARTVTTGTTILVGSESPAFMRDAAEQLGKTIRNATVHHLEGEAHAATPEAVALAVR